MSAIRNKQRLIHLYRYLMENTDEEHQSTTNELVEFLKKEDANASRKTVKDDIEILMKEGVDIVTTKSYYNSYFIGSRDFEIPEIKILADCVASNVSLTYEQKTKLIDKLLSLLGKHQAEKLKAHVHLAGNRGGGNEQLYYSIDQITEAIGDGHKIEYQYYKYEPNGDRTLRDNGEFREMTPVAITCSDNRFYVIGYSSDSHSIVCERLDCMSRTRAIEEKSDKLPSGIHIEDYPDSLFDMEIGQPADVTLECANEMMDVIRDRFGSGLDLWKSTPDSFYVKTRVSVSPAFLGWVFQYGGKIRITSPVSVYETYQNQAREVLRRGKRK
ncbi:MAG TPA: hypothetical protein DCF49_02165 [Lachnospiraceae bacterium]|nr:hypothetical protein [Lachnospiraceae bacterium]